MNDHHPSTKYSFLFIPFLYPVELFSEVIFLLEKFHNLEKKEKERLFLQQVRIKGFI
jgi:hypothetical protein